MTHRAFASGGATRRLVLVAAALVVACSGGGDKVGTPLRVCVLQGTTVSEGCYVGDDGKPRIALGSLAIGEQKTRVTTMAAGSTSVDIEEVALVGDSLANYALQLYTLADGVETPVVALPVKLVKSNGVTELRARVRFEANQSSGAIGGVSLHLVSPQVEMTIPITGEVYDCPGGRGDCDGNHLNGCETDLTADLSHCGTCGNGCLGKANVDDGNGGAVCDLGSCKVSLCTATWFNQNQAFDDGCECQQDALADSCGAATWSGNVPAGQSREMTGNIVPIDEADYIAISWQDVESWQTFHPRIELVDESGVLAFDLTVGCGVSVSCNLDAERAASPAAVGLRSWETYCFPGQAGCNYILSRAAGATSPVGEYTVVKVYSTATTANQTCLPYTLKISNAVAPQ